MLTTLRRILENMQKILNFAKLLLLLLTQSSCTPWNEDEEVLNVYRSGIGEIINTKLCEGCIRYNPELDKRFKDYVSDDQKRDRYVGLFDSLINVRTSLQPKCVIAYSNRKGHIWGEDADQTATLDDMQESIRYTIAHRGVEGDFGEASVLIDKLTTPSSVDPQILSTDFADIISYETGDRRVLPDTVIGIMSFSQIALIRIYTMPFCTLSIIVDISVGAGNLYTCLGKIKLGWWTKWNPFSTRNCQCRRPRRSLQARIKIWRA
jgi:hypothetical protein